MEKDLLEKLDNEITDTLNVISEIEDGNNALIFGDEKAADESMEYKTVFEINAENGQLQQEIEALKKQLATYRYDASFGKVQEEIQGLGIND